MEERQTTNLGPEMEASRNTMHQLTLPKTHQPQAQEHWGRALWHAAPHTQDLKYWQHSRWLVSEASRGIQEGSYMQCLSLRSSVSAITAVKWCTEDDVLHIYIKKNTETNYAWRN